MAGVVVSQVGGNTTSTRGDQRALMDMVLIVDGKKTPFMSMVPKGGYQDSMVYEWPLDLEEDVIDAATVDGTPVSDVGNAQSNYTVIANRMQFNRVAKGVSVLTEFQNQAGVSNKKAYARAKALRQLLYSAEAVMLSEQDVQVGTASVANKLRGVGNWLTAGAISTSGYAVGADFQPDSNQVVSTGTDSVTETTLNGVMAATWDRGGVEPEQAYVVLCGRLFKQRISSLTGFASGTNAYQNVRTYNADLSKKILWQTVDTFVGDFGKAELYPDQFMAHPAIGGTSPKNQRFAYGLNMSTWDVIDGKIPAVKDLAYDGSGEQTEFRNLLGLRCKAPLRNWAIKSTAA